MAWYDSITKGFSGLVGGVTDILNSEGAGSLIDAGSSYLTADLNRAAMDAAAEAEAKKLAADNSAKYTLPEWVAPAGIGLAGLLFAGLLFSMFSRRK